MSLWLLCILTWTLTWIQTNVCSFVHQQTNKQTCAPANNKQTTMYGYVKRGLKPFNLTERSPCTLTTTKTKTNEVAGAWFAWIVMLIVTGIFDFINVHWFQCHDQGSVSDYRVDDRRACTTAWHRILMLLMSWPAENKRHNSTQKNMFFIDSSWPLVFILQLFNWDLIPYFEILPFPRWHNHNK